MKLRYLVKKRFKKKGSALPIYLALYQNDETELIYTKERIKPSEWSEAERIPKDHTSDIFARIEKVKSLVQRSIKILESQDKPVTPFTVKEEYSKNRKERDSDQRLNDKNAKADKKSVSFLADKWTENSLFSYKASTQNTVKESINQFKTFLKISGLTGLEKKELNKEIISSYERYLQDKKKLSNSTHGKRMKHLRWFLKSINYDVGAIKIRTHKKGIIALTIDELQALEEVDVNDNSEYQKAKDMFLLGCYTGLRISDLKRINETRIIEGNICMTLQKNKKEISIPVRDEVMIILEKYGMRSPKISEQHLNKSIKKVCELADINKLLTVKNNVAGRDVETEQPKYDLITSHTASKTFITLAPKRFGMTPAEIAAIVGKDLKTLINHYFQLPLESAKQKMIKSK